MHELPTLDKIELDGYVFDPGYYLGSEYLDISTASQELPPIIEWLNAKYQSFAEQKLSTEHHLKRARATAYFRLTEGGYFVETYGTKPTQAALGHAIELDAAVCQLEDEYAKLYAWCGRLFNLQNSLRAKLDLVRSTESTRRAMIQHSDFDNSHLTQ